MFPFKKNSFTQQVTALLFLALVADVYSGAIVAQPAAIISAKSELAEDVETDSHPSYSFSYAVDDVTTGDHKSQFETRDGDAVVGRVSLIFQERTLKLPRMFVKLDFSCIF